MIQTILRELGFSLNEAKIYEALLELKEAAVGEISLKAEVHRRNVYDALNRLVDKGLVFPVMTKGENLYCPVDPEKLMELVREKEVNLTKIMPELKKRYQENVSAQEAYIYRGIEGFKNYMLDVVRTGKDVYVIGAKLSWLDPQIKNFTERILKEMNRKKISFHVLYDWKVKEFSTDLHEFGKSHKFLPEGYDTNSTINIFGDYVVTYTGLYEKKIDEKGTLFVLKDKKLADSYRKWFEFMWNSCKK